MEQNKLKNHVKAVVTISTIKGYANGSYAVGWSLEEFAERLQVIEETTFADNSISWLVRPGKAIYKLTWGAPKGGEDVFVLEADYTEYDKDITINEWKNRIFNHAEYLRKYFAQETVRVTFIDGVETTILR